MSHKGKVVQAADSSGIIFVLLFCSLVSLQQSHPQQTSRLSYNQNPQCAELVFPSFLTIAVNHCFNASSVKTEFMHSISPLLSTGSQKFSYSYRSFAQLSQFINQPDSYMLSQAVSYVWQWTSFI